MQFVRSIKHVQTKILAGFVALALISVGLGAFTLVRMGTLRDDAVLLHDDDLRATDALGEARVGLFQTATSILQLVVNTAPEAQERNSVALQNGITQLNDAMAKYRSTDTGDVSAQLAEIDRQVKELTDLALGVLLPAVQSRDIATFVARGSQDALPLFNSLDASLQELLDAEQVSSDATYARAQDAYGTTRLLVLIVVFLAVVIAIVLGVLTAQTISRPLRKSVTALRQVAEGDLTVEVHANRADEMGQLAEALNQMVDQTRATVEAIAQSAAQLSAASEELTAVSRELSTTAEETTAQAMSASAASEQVSANVNTVASGTEQMGASIREIAGNATQAASVASSAADVAAETNTTVAKLGESSAEIGEVLAVITSIAEQTNLLALNATIEAARAGEAGKGFAVVANEVKELAKETAKATGDIGTRIAAIQGDAGAVAGAIAQITSVIGEITDFQGTIASAVEEQTVTTSEIARNVAEAAAGTSGIAATVSTVADASQQTSSGAANILTSADDLSRQADELNRLVTQFRT